MSANDILDVLNIQRDGQNQPPKKKQKSGSDQNAPPRQTGMARELYNLLGPNTPPINLSLTGNTSQRDKINFRPSPWTRMPFQTNKKTSNASPKLYHWVKGSKDLLERESAERAYAFDKFNVGLDIPDMVDRESYDRFVSELKETEKANEKSSDKTIEKSESKSTKIDQAAEEQKKKTLEMDSKNSESGTGKPEDKPAETEDSSKESSLEKSNEKPDESTKQQSSDEPKTTSNEASKSPEKESSKTESNEESQEESGESQEGDAESNEFTYEDTQLLFELCKSFELKWHIIYDRFPSDNHTLEDLKDHFYKISAKILQQKENSNPALLESLSSYSKTREAERKKYLESLLKRTPAEVAEEESLVIEARRFELAAKKMLMERSHLLTLLDSPQTSQSVQQYQSSQGLANLYNNLMILDKHQKKRQFQQQQRANTTINHEPVPPPIPSAASSSFKKDRSFQTHLQQYLSGLLKQQQASGVNLKSEPNAIQQLLSKRLTVKEEEAYGLHYHANEKLAPGVILRSSQKLPGLQQRQSVLKSVNSVLQELDIPTAGGTSWKPIMPTRKTMAKYDELLRSVVALLEVKKGKDKLESEIKLIKSQRGLQ